MISKRVSFRSASNYHKETISNKKCTKTGCNALDDLLNGGIVCGDITEIFGEYGTGKTQLIHQLAVSSQLPVEYGGINGLVLWIDTQSTFRSERIGHIADRFELDSQCLLQNITIATAYTVDHQIELLKEARRIMIESDRKYGLVIIDCATFLFRSEYNKLEQMKDRDNVLSELFGELRKLCDIFGVVLITNQIQEIQDIEGNASVNDSKHEAYGDTVIAHSSKRIELKRMENQKRKARTYSAYNLPNNQITFVINHNGICDE